MSRGFESALNAINDPPEPPPMPMTKKRVTFDVDRDRRGHGDGHCCVGGHWHVCGYGGHDRDGTGTGTATETEDDQDHDQESRRDLDSGRSRTVMMCVCILSLMTILALMFGIYWSIDFNDLKGQEIVVKGSILAILIVSFLVVGTAAMDDKCSWTAAYKEWREGQGDGAGIASSSSVVGVAPEVKEDSDDKVKVDGEEGPEVVAGTGSDDADGDVKVKDVKKVKVVKVKDVKKVKVVDKEVKCKYEQEKDEDEEKSEEEDEAAEVDSDVGAGGDKVKKTQ